MDHLLEKLVRSPRLVLYQQRIQAILEAEQAVRQRFYQLSATGVKSEFINGEVIMHSPVKLKLTNASRRLLNLLATFVEQHQLGFVGYEKTLVSLSRNDYEPEICFFVTTKAQAFTRDQVRFPAPDFVVEFISPGTGTTDRVTKMDDYAAHGVTEYWIIDPETETVEQYILHSDTYTLHTKARTGTLTSVAVTGFTIPVRAIFEGAEMLAALRQIME